MDRMMTESDETGRAAGDTQGARRAPAVSPAKGVEFSAAANPEVSAKASRRRFTAEYKRSILRQADACTKPGETGALLRREGLYSSHLTVWRKQRDQAEAAGLSPKKRGQKPAPINPLAKRVAELERENRRLEQRLARQQLLLDIQKKVSELLGIPLAGLESEGSNS